MNATHTPHKKPRSISNPTSSSYIKNHFINVIRYAEETRYLPHHIANYSKNTASALAVFLLRLGAKSNIRLTRPE